MEGYKILLKSKFFKYSIIQKIGERSNMRISQQRFSDFPIFF